MDAPGGRLRQAGDSHHRVLRPLGAPARKGQIDLAWIYLRLAGYPGQTDGHRPRRGDDEGLLRRRPRLLHAGGDRQRGHHRRTGRKSSRPCSRPCRAAIPSPPSNPDEAAEILLRAVPELDRTLVLESQRWVSAYYIAEAPRWGEQKESVWRDYADWMVENGVITTPIDPTGRLHQPVLALAAG